MIPKLNLRTLTASAAVCLAAWSCSTLVATAQAANAYVDTTQQLRLRLKNELRRAHKPSAGTNDEIYAWVQGLMLEYDSGWLNDWLGVEAGGFWVQRLDTDDNMHTRWYLNDRDSFGYATAAVKVKLGEYGLIKAGRFITDQGYGALPYYVPVLTSNSNRTLPSASQGVLLYLTPTDFMDIWAVWRNEVFTSTSALLDGFRNEGVYNSATGDYDDQKANNILAVSFYGDNWRWSTGGGYQKDVITQAMTQLDNTFALEQGNKITTSLRYAYAKAEGDSEDLVKTHGWPDGESNLITGSMTYHTSWGSLGFSVGYLDHKSMGQVWDSDLGYPFALSIDRNMEDMMAYQLSANFKLPHDFSFSIAPIYTNGYEDASKQVSVEGYDLNVSVAYMPKSGPLAGLRAYIAADRGFEDRPGSVYGDRLNYWDIKMSVQYDINFLK